VCWVVSQFGELNVLLADFVMAEPARYAVMRFL
jgi:hypothetical protein